MAVSSPSLLGLVAAGFKDEVIAKQMDLDPRTVRRRLRRLMDALGAETRFQAGMQVVRRGLALSVGHQPGIRGSTIAPHPG